MDRWFSIALAALVATSCNLVLDNERRTLDAPNLIVDGGDLSPPTPPVPLEDAGRTSGCGLPECSPGETDSRSPSCGLCNAGTQMRERICTDDCTWGPFADQGDCVVPEDLCTEGERQEMPMPCGPCNSGMLIASRVCTDQCHWSDWTPGTCDVPDDRCEPGAMETLPAVACDAMCGKASQTRQCNAECMWDAPVAGPCTGQGDCSPGATRMSMGACNANYCNKGEQMQRETCTQECTWNPPVSVGSCTIPANVCRPTDLGGVGWRCRQNDPGFRESCRAATASELLRCTWSGSREAYQDC